MIGVSAYAERARWAVWDMPASVVPQRYLDKILEHIMGHDGVWQATTDEIADYYLANCYDEAVEYARSLRMLETGWTPAHGRSST